MPLFYTDNINLTAKLAVWEITEDEDFFKSRQISGLEISHPHKRIQHLAGRFLLQKIEPAFPVNQIKMDGKRPYLPGNVWNFSISHSRDFAATLISGTHKVGIDIEPVTPRIERLEQKFLNEKEQVLIADSATTLSHQQKLTACWCAKECMFKWYQRGGLDFKNHMIIRHLSFEQEGLINAVFSKGVRKELPIHFKFLEELCLAWLID